jgi:hypothetical protein
MGRGGFPPSKTGSFSAYHTASGGSVCFSVPTSYVLRLTVSQEHSILKECVWITNKNTDPPALEELETAAQDSRLQRRVTVGNNCLVASSLETTASTSWCVACGISLPEKMITFTSGRRLFIS